MFYTQFVITPTCFDLSWSSSGSYWTPFVCMYIHIHIHTYQYSELFLYPCL